MFGVYLLAQVCAVVTFWIYYQLARAIVGGQQAVLAVLLSLTVVAFSSPGVEFGPLVLARPLWALLLLHSWQLIGQNRRNAWFAWSIEAGLLLLTTSAAPGLLLLLAGFAVATARGRRVLMSLDPLYALLVIVVLVLPYLIWLLRADALAMPPWPAISDLGARALHWGGLLGGLVLAMSGIVLLAILNSGWFARNAEEAPIIYRPPVDPLARDFVYFFAIAPALLGSLIAGLFNLDRVVGGAGVALADVGAGRDRGDRRSDLSAASARCCARSGRRRSSRLPWRRSRRRCSCPGPAATEVPTSLPAKAIAQFFGDSFERRTNQRLRAVAGDPQLASFDRDGPRPPASVARRHAGTNAVAVGREIQRDRRRRGLARLRHVRHAAARDRAAFSRPGAGSAARLRMDGERPPAAAARRLGHRAAEGAVSSGSSW